MKNQRRPVVLCILDGWGYREDTADNGIALASTPIYDMLLAKMPNALLQTSGKAVGLPEGQMGNSEVGHQSIGAGRVVLQDLPRIDAAIKDGSLEKNQTLHKFISRLLTNGNSCHLLGLLSPGGVHSHQKHMMVLAKIIANSGIPVWLHCIMDGRDTPPNSGLQHMNMIIDEISGVNSIRIGTVCGRYYAMDRDKRWDRVQQAYQALISGSQNLEIGAFADPASVIQESYDKNIQDEFIIPTCIDGYPGMIDGDGLLMSNFRADRAREILAALVDPKFDGFFRSRVVKFSDRIGMVNYSSLLDVLMGNLFPQQEILQTLGEVVAQKNLRQLRIAETEKYAHVTFFLNGGIESTFEGEDRIMVPSPKVSTYDTAPEMSAGEVTEKLVKAIDSQEYDLIVVNYANPDMVGHTGKIDAAILAAEMIDRCLYKVWAAVERVNGCVLLTADHGNIEMMSDPKTLGEHTAHTTEPVPVILINGPMRSEEQRVGLKNGSLADVAPTILDLMNQSQPTEMTGKSLLKNSAKIGKC